MSESELSDRSLLDFEFELEVSARYHDWRRASLDLWARTARAATMLGAVVALVFTLGGSGQWFVSGAAAFVAVFSLIDLTFRFDIGARQHTDLYRRYKVVQEKVARKRIEWKQLLPEWGGDLQAIRQDEPPVLWVVYAMCWNQTIERRGVEVGYLRKVAFWRRLLGWVYPFKPHEFPLIKSSA